MKKILLVRLIYSKPISIPSPWSVKGRWHWQALDRRSFLHDHAIIHGSSKLHVVKAVQVLWSWATAALPASNYQSYTDNQKKKTSWATECINKRLVQCISFIFAFCPIIITSTDTNTFVLAVNVAFSTIFAVDVVLLASLICWCRVGLSWCNAGWRLLRHA